MRNLLQYPVTSEEIFDAINQIPYDPQLIGNMNGVLKRGLAEYFKNEERMAELLEQMRIKI
ncbi:MAG: hypothetical protein KGI25_07775 [Thaumarchaeota archaeon]|nr:hypothetical protein [Nitrososphaerota archaeon]